MKTKKITALLLAFAMIFALLPTSVFADASENGWTLENGTLTISSDEGMIDWWENGKATLANDVTKLFIEENVTEIPSGDDQNGNCSPFCVDENGNGCGALTEVEIKGETSIGSHAFYCCYSLTKVTAKKATSVGEDAFVLCDKLTDISLPVASSIGDNAFDGCGALTEISLPAASSIGNLAFNTCDALKTVSLGSLDKIGFNAFLLCYSLTNINFTNVTAPTGIHNEAFNIIWNKSPITISYPCQSKGDYEKAFEGKLGGTKGAGATLAPAHTTDESKWEKGENTHWHICTVCQEKLDEAAHDFGEWATTKEPTCTENGSQERICSICQYKETGVINAIGHDFGTEWQKDKNNHWHECQRTNCDEKKDEAPHIWDDGVVTTKPTYTAKGEKTFTCSVCEATKTEEIPKLKRPVPPVVTDPDEEIDQGVTDDPTIDTVLPDGSVVPGKKLPVITVDPGAGTTNPPTGDSIFANLF